MDWAAIETAIEAWVENATGLMAVWMNSARPMSTKPYIVLQITSTSIEGIDYVDYAFDAGPPEHLSPSINGYRLINVQVSCISRNQNPGLDALNYLEIARTKLHQPTIREALKAAGLAINWDSAIILVRDTKFDNRMESRAIFDVQFRAVQMIDLSPDPSSDESFIDQIELSSDIEDVDPDLNLTDELIPQE